MKITKSQLKQLIKEELESVLNEFRDPKANPTYDLAVRKITAALDDALQWADVEFAGIGSDPSGSEDDFVVRFRLKTS
jgi:hypothetical protein